MWFLHTKEFSIVSKVFNYFTQRFLRVIIYSKAKSLNDKTIYRIQNKKKLQDDLRLLFPLSGSIFTFKSRDKDTSIKFQISCFHLWFICCSNCSSITICTGSTAGFLSPLLYSIYQNVSLYAFFTFPMLLLYCVYQNSIVSLSSLVHVQNPFPLSHFT